MYIPVSLDSNMLKSVSCPIRPLHRLVKFRYLTDDTQSTTQSFKPIILFQSRGFEYFELNYLFRPHLILHIIRILFTWFITIYSSITTTFPFQNECKKHLLTTSRCTTKNFNLFLLFRLISLRSVCYDSLNLKNPQLPED